MPNPENKDSPRNEQLNDSPQPAPQIRRRTFERTIEEFDPPMPDLGDVDFDGEE